MTELMTYPRDRLFAGIGDDALLDEYWAKLQAAVAFASEACGGRDQIGRVPLGDANGAEFMRLHRLAEEAHARWHATIDADRLHRRRREIAEREKAGHGLGRRKAA